MSDDGATTSGEHPKSSLWHTLLDKARLSKRARRHRRRRIRLIILISLAALLTGGYLYMTSDRQVERLVKDYLEDLFNSDVRIHRASFSFFGGLEIENIRVVVDDPAYPVFQAERVRLTHDPLALLVGKLKVSELLAIRPKIDLVETDEGWNYVRLFPRKRLRLRQRPVIYVEDGVLNVRQFDGKKLIYDHELKLSGVVQPSAARSDLLSFFASELSSEGLRGHISRGTINVRERTLSFEGQVVNVDLSERLAETLPPEARKVWNTFRPEGQASIKILFGDERTGRRDVGFRAEVNLNGVAMSYVHNGRTFHLRDLTGQCVIDPGEVTLRNVHGVLSTLVARGDGRQEEVTLALGLGGRVFGMADDAFGQDLDVTVEDLDLGRIRPLAADLLTGGKKFYDNLQPSGRVDLSLKVRREAVPGAKLRTTGSITLKDGRAVHRLFPYAIDDVSGTFEVHDDRIEITRLVGRHGRSTIEASGVVHHVGKPGQRSRFVIRGKGLLLDEALREAMAQDHGEQLAIYDSLNPEGTVDATMHVVEDVGAADSVTAEIDIDLRGAAMTYDQFRYRLTDCTGRLYIGAEKTTVDVHGRHGPARFDIAGTISRVDDNPEHLLMDLKVTGRGVPLDDDLSAALQAEHREIYDQYHLTGQADVTVDIHCGPDTAWQVTHKAVIELRDVGMVFEPFPFPIQGIEGRIEMSPERFEIKGLRGANADAAITAVGHVKQKDQSAEIDLTIRGRNVLLDRDLRGAIALVAPQLWENLAAEGHVDITCRLVQKAAPGSQLAAEITLDARDVAVSYKHFPYPLKHCRGRVTYRDGRVTIENLENTDGATRIAVSGTVDVHAPGGIRSDLSLRATALAIDGAMIDALPKDVGDVLRKLSAKGQIHARIDRLVYVVGADGAVSASWSGSVVLDNASVDLGVPIDRVVAYVRLSGSFEGERLALEGAIDMPQGRIDGKRITDLHGKLSKQAGSQRVTISKLEGNIYGGRFELDGAGRLILADPTRYGLAVRIRDVDFERFVRDGLALAVPVEGGRMDGEFAMWGRDDQSDSVAARVTFSVRKAQLYQLPMVVRLLNVLSLNPYAKSFEEADVTLFKRKGSYIFESIVLRGTNLSVHGAGRIDPGGKLNFVFTTGTGRTTGILAVLDDLAEGLRRELVLVEITGTTTEPKVKQTSFKTLSAPLRELTNAIKESRAMQREQAKERAEP
jgi:hypothetical protein